MGKNTDWTTDIGWHYWLSQYIKAIVLHQREFEFEFWPIRKFHFIQPGPVPSTILNYCPIRWLLFHPPDRWYQSTNHPMSVDWTQLQFLVLAAKLSYRPEPYFTQVLIFRFLNPSKRLPTCVICYAFQVASVECKARTFVIRSCCFNLINLAGFFLGFDIICADHLNFKAASSLRKQLIKVSSHN